MKKCLFSMAILATIVVSSCGVLKEQSPIVAQTEPVIQRLYVVDIPRTDQMIFKNVLPDTQKIIGATNIKGEGRFLLVSTEMYNSIKATSEGYEDLYKKSSIPQDRFVGMDLAVSHIGKLSLISAKQINDMATEQEKELARTLNDYNKYTLIGESPKPVLMMRTADGKFVPDFSFSQSAPEPDTRKAPPPPKQKNSHGQEESEFWKEFKRKYGN